MPRSPIHHPAVVLDLRIDTAVADKSKSAHLRRLEKRVRAEAIADSSPRGFRVGRDRIDLGAADVVVKSHVTNRQMLDWIGGRRAWPIAGDLDILRYRVIGIERPVAEIPHHLQRRIRIVRIDQRKRQTGRIAFQCPVGREAHLWRIFLSRGFVRRRPLEPIGRHDLHRHALLHEDEISRTDKVGNLVGLIRRDSVPGTHASARRVGKRQNRERD